MGFPWHPTNAPLDAGIDGHVELRDPLSGEVSNVWLAVQSKARTTLENETTKTFSFQCSSRDLDYWRKGNMPVLLIVVRPNTDEVWWKSIKDYFKDPQNTKSKKIVFDKETDTLTVNSSDRLLQIAQSTGSGAYFRPSPKQENLDTNLLKVTRQPTAIYRASTSTTDPKEVSKQLRELEEYPAREWVLRDKAIYSVHDLREYPWQEICEQGTVEKFQGEDFSDSDDSDMQRLYVWMLNSCLKSRLGRAGMHWRSDQKCFYFKKTDDLSPRIKHYKSRQQKAKREVFKGYRSKKDPEKIAYYRHVGFEPRFQKFDGQYCLEINPTYLFTTDGKDLHPYHQEYLSTIKTIEGSGAIGNLVVMFARLLADRTGLFANNYPFLGFGSLVQATYNVGINDASWSNAKSSGRTNHKEVDAEDADSLLQAVKDRESSLFGNLFQDD